jgi:hypothetical protein
LARHVGQKHDLQQYYRDFFYDGNPAKFGQCKYCLASTRFIGLTGYKSVCKEHEYLLRSESAKSHRAKLKADPTRFQSFQKRVQQNQTSIWKQREADNTKTIILDKAITTQRQTIDSMSEKERKQKFSRYHTCDADKIKELNEKGRQQCMANWRSGKTGFKNCMKGIFKPKNPQKYKGNSKNIIYRSSYELDYMIRLDENERVVAWASEEISIPYFHPFKQRMARYYPDMLFEIKNNDNTTSKLLVEIKPANQLAQPVRGKRAMKTYMEEMMTWTVNQTKWQAAKKWCEHANAKFIVVTKVNDKFKILNESQLGL